MESTTEEQKNCIRTRLRSFIIQNFLFGDESSEFSDGDSFLGTNLIDSTGVIELVQYLETAYSITISDDELLPENLDSVDNVVRFVQSKRQN